MMARLVHALPAPEVRIHRKGYTSAVDMWSLGVIIFVILSGYHPFDPEGIASEDELQSNIKRGRFDFDDPVWDTVSDSAKELIESLIRLDPADRLDCRAILAHPWVKVRSRIVCCVMCGAYSCTAHTRTHAHHYMCVLVVVAHTTEVHASSPQKASHITTHVC